MSYQDDSGPSPGQIIGIIAVIVAVIFVGTIGIRYLSTASTVASAPAAVVGRTFDTDNILNSYEDFRDTYQNYLARQAQIKSYSKLLKTTTDKDELESLRVEVEGQKQSCRDLVARYNSNSSKANRNIFKLGGGSLPDSLNLEDCE